VVTKARFSGAPGGYSPNKRTKWGQTMDRLEELIAIRPRFHEPETEIQRPFDPSESFLPASEAAMIQGAELAHYGIGDEVLRFLVARTASGDRTLEIGAGSTTLAFAIQQTQHTAVCPSSEEVGRISQYADEHGIDLGRVRFVVKPSEVFLPGADLGPLDLVLLDGKHAFPWPMLDWFFTAPSLRTGGLLLIDDVQLRAVSILVDFLAADTSWESADDFGKTRVFRKVRDDLLDVAWHMQPWMRQESGHVERPGIGRRLSALKGRLSR
jgi:predicted O-methyltransferase YrrM